MISAPGNTASRRRLNMLAAALLLACAPGAHALDLIQGYHLALQNDALYQAALAANQAGQEALPQARAQLMPNLSANGTRSKNWTDGETMGLSGPVTRSYEYMGTSAAVSVRQPLYRKYNFAHYKQAQFQVANADAVLDKDRQDLLVRLSGAYFESLMAQEQLSLVLAQKEAYAGQLAAAKRAFETGSGTRTDIDDAQARYDLSLAEELAARQNVGYTRTQLQVIIDQPAENLATLDAAKLELLPPAPADVEAWMTRAVENNAELRAIRANVEAAQQEVEKARSGHYPTVDVYAQRSKSDSDSNNTINTQYLTTQVGVQFSIPIWAGGQVNSAVRQALANLEKTRSQYEARRREISQQVRKEFQNVAEGVLKVRALEQATRSADQSVFSNEKGYQAGTRTLIDILNAQQQRMNVRRDLSMARYQYVMARIRLQGMMNSLDEAEMARINGWLNTPAK